MSVVFFSLVASATSPEWVLEAEHLEVEDGVITAENVEIPVGQGLLHAEHLEAAVDGQTVRLQSVLLAPCACEGAEPWSIQAQSAEIEVGTSARLQGGWVRVFDVPLVPIPPASIPLRRRSGLLVPTVGLGPYGLLVAQPVYLTATEQADVTVTPEVRSRQSLRAIGEARYALIDGSGEIGGAFGRDWETQTYRGAVQWDHAQDRSGAFAASRGQVLGDAAYLKTYGDSFLARRLPFVETRSLGGFGPLEFGARTVQFGGPTDQDIASMAIRRGGIDGPWGMVQSVEVFSGWSVYGGVPWDTALGGGRLQGRVTASRPTWVGPVRFTPAVALLALGDTDARTGDRSLLARSPVEMDTRLGLWRDGDRAYERLEPGVRVVANPEIVDGTLDSELRVSPWEVAPGVSWRRTGTEGLVALRAEVPVDDRGFGASVDGRILSGPWTGWIQAESGRVDRRGAFLDLLELGTAGVSWSMNALDLSGSWIYADRVQLPQVPPELEELHQGRWAVGLTPPRLDVIRLDGGMVHRLDDGTIQQRWIGAAYTHPSSCLAVIGRGWLDADRGAPEASLNVNFKL